MLVTIATAAGGAGAQMQAGPWPVHFALAIAALVINLWAFRLEYRTGDGKLPEFSKPCLGKWTEFAREKGLPPNDECLRGGGGVSPNFSKLHSVRGQKEDSFSSN